MARIISVETGTDICSVGLSENGKLISLRESLEGRNHASDVALFVEEILQENSVAASQIDALAVGIGPGSYTGLRIGVSFAKGFCYSRNIPMIAIESLESLCHCAIQDTQSGLIDLDITPNTLFVPMIDARRMEVYTQVYDSSVVALTPIEAKIIDQDSFVEYRDSQFVMFGNGAQKCVDVLSLDNIKLIDVSPSVRGMVATAHKKFESQDFVDLAYFEPLYLKNFIGTKSSKKFF